MAAPPLAAQTLQIDYGRELGTYRYRFANPSTFDTPQLVPHFFEQKYDTNNDWLVGRLAYGGRLRATTEAGLSRDAARTASDFDTFYDPSGDVITSGTTGEATMSAWRVRQDLSLGGRVHIGYAFRRDTADFLAGNKSVTHTLPPSAEYSIITTRETTHSDVHELIVGARGAHARSSKSDGGLHVAWSVDAAPATIARLDVLLPDKYPGQPLRFTATAIAGDAEVALRRRAGPTWIDVRVRVTGAHSYLRRSQFSQHAIAIGAGVGWR